MQADLPSRDLRQYRNSEREQLRTRDLLDLIPSHGQRALDIGARDGHFSRLLAQRFTEVHALDLQRPRFEHPGVVCVQGDATALEYPDGHFDFVFCAEVLEHIPCALLPRACTELARVCSGQLLIGVPDRQDLRVGSTTCAHCGQRNPPWGHVNRFDARSLAALFQGCTVEHTRSVGQNSDQSNALSHWLMGLAGDPFGTYAQDEPCVHCGHSIGQPKPRNLGQRVATRLAVLSQHVSRLWNPPHPNWLHMRLRAPGRTAHEG